MTIATYRGVKYDTDAIKQDYKTWWNAIHHDASKYLKYRGMDYRPVRSSDAIEQFN